MLRKTLVQEERQLTVAVWRVRLFSRERHKHVRQTRQGLVNGLRLLEARALGVTT